MTIVILGVGNRMRADDGIGSIIASELMSHLPDNILVYDAESSPENYIDKIVQAKPDWVIFIDACNFKAQPGEFKLFEESEIQDISYGLLSTHTLPLTLTIELIKQQHKCRISLLGIQPKSFLMGMEMSDEISSNKSRIIDYLLKIIHNK
ncbi:MAG: hydrogenase 3 maturation endopeptidase HyCI [Candidatus Latescibacteria bacterium]|nr:hydrogenase 3 maturation endopeptidase HyCI [Candidatus Latescibacterota bacterium]